MITGRSLSLVFPLSGSTQMTECFIHFSSLRSGKSSRAWAPRALRRGSRRPAPTCTTKRRWTPPRRARALPPPRPRRSPRGSTGSPRAATPPRALQAPARLRRALALGCGTRSGQQTKGTRERRGQGRAGRVEFSRAERLSREPAAQHSRAAKAAGDAVDPSGRALQTRVHAYIRPCAGAGVL